MQRTKCIKKCPMSIIPVHTPGAKRMHHIPVQSRALALCIPGFLLGVDVPDHVVRETVDAVARSFRHLREALCFGLVFEGVAGEVDA